LSITSGGVAVAITVITAPSYGAVVIAAGGGDQKKAALIAPP
jgi:hypothetical protein